MYDFAQFLLHVRLDVEPESCAVRHLRESQAGLCLPTSDPWHGVRVLFFLAFSKMPPGVRPSISPLPWTGSGDGTSLNTKARPRSGHSLAPAGHVAKKKIGRPIGPSSGHGNPPRCGPAFSQRCRTSTLPAASRRRGSLPVQRPSGGAPPPSPRGPSRSVPMAVPDADQIRHEHPSVDRFLHP